MLYKRQITQEGLLKCRSFIKENRNPPSSLQFSSCDKQCCKKYRELLWLLNELLFTNGIHEKGIKDSIFFPIVYFNDMRVNIDIFYDEMLNRTVKLKKERQKQELLHTLHFTLQSTQKRLEKQYDKITIFNEENPDNQIVIRDPPIIHYDAFKEDFLNQQKIADDYHDERRHFCIESRSFINTHIKQFSTPFFHIKQQKPSSSSFTLLNNFSDYHLYVLYKRNLFKDLIDTCNRPSLIDFKEKKFITSKPLSKDKDFIWLFDEYPHPDFRFAMQIHAVLKMESVILRSWYHFFNKDNKGNTVPHIGSNCIVLLKEEDTFIGTYGNEKLFVFMKNELFYDDLPTKGLLPFLDDSHYPLHYNQFCSNCYKWKEKTMSFDRCGRCQVRHYCSKECQRKDWYSRHSKVCKKT